MSAASASVRSTIERGPTATLPLAEEKPESTTLAAASRAQRRRGSGRGHPAPLPCDLVARRWASRSLLPRSASARSASPGADA